MVNPHTARLDQARLIANRLERLSVDSQWARRASGLRGALLRLVDRLESAEPLEREETVQMDRLFKQCFDILSRAAREIPES